MNKQLLKSETPKKLRGQPQLAVILDDYSWYEEDSKSIINKDPIIYVPTTK